MCVYIISGGFFFLFPHLLQGTPVIPSCLAPAPSRVEAWQPSVICHRSCVHTSLYQCILSIISIISYHSGWVFCGFLRCNSRSSTLQSWMCLLGNHQIPANQRHNAKHLPCEVAFKTFPAAFPGALEVK